MNYSTLITIFRMKNTVNIIKNNTFSKENKKVKISGLSQADLEKIKKWYANFNGPKSLFSSTDGLLVLENVLDKLDNFTFPLEVETFDFHAHTISFRCKNTNNEERVVLFFPGDTIDLPPTMYLVGDDKVKEAHLLYNSENLECTIFEKEYDEYFQQIMNNNHKGIHK